MFRILKAARMAIDFILDLSTRPGYGRNSGTMQCGGSILMALARPDMFSHYALLSGGVYKPEEIKDKSKVKLIFLSCGSFESPDRIIAATDSLKSAGFNVVSYVSQNTRHEFQTWRRSLYVLAPLLFKDTK